MVDANDDPSTPAYKQIEEMVEAQVCVTQQAALYFTLQNLFKCSRLCWRPNARYWNSIHN